MLFRKEAQEAQADQWIGSIRLTRPFSFSVVTLSAIALSAALVFFVTWGEVNRKARITGILVPVHGSLNITAPQAGVLVERRVKEGEIVSAGDALLILDSERRSLLGDSANAVTDTADQIARQIESRRRSLLDEQQLKRSEAAQRDRMLVEKARLLRAQLSSAVDEGSGQRSRLTFAQKNLARHQSLAASGFISDAQVEIRQDELIEVKNRLETIQRAILAIRQELHDVESARQSISTNLQSDVANLDRQLATNAQEANENASRKGAVVIAPRSTNTASHYRVTGMSVQVGQFVQAGQTLATLVAAPPNDSTSPGRQMTSSEAALEAQLFAPSRTIGFVSPGQTVYLRYAAYPYQKFGLFRGTIASVSDTPFSSNELPQNISAQILSQAGVQEAVYRINVELIEQTVRAYGHEHPLKAGLTLDADVFQERRRIWEWIFEPMLAARAQLSSFGSQSD